MQPHILITGATGFIGRNLAEHLRKSCVVHAPLHSELDLRDEDAVKAYMTSHKVDIVIHTAKSGGMRDMVDTFYVVDCNLRMFFNIVRSLNCGQRMIHLGSGSEYDSRHYLPRMSEDYFDVHVPVDRYGFSKYLCSKFILESKANIVCLRLFGVFGKHEKYHLRFISNAIIKNILSLPITIKQNAYYDYLYVEDLVLIVEHFVFHHPQEKIYNVCTGKAVDLLSIAHIVNRVGEKHSEMNVLRDGLGREYSGANEKLIKELPHFSFTPLEGAIRDLYGWYKDHMDILNLDSIYKSDEVIMHDRVQHIENQP